jgi:hypothetical protein
MMMIGLGGGEPAAAGGGIGGREMRVEQPQQVG